ncbi:MAG: antibiotic biosynthesis monooxygenase [Myxococcota bacterium]
MIHVAITRTVRSGQQEEFERRVAEFFAEAQDDPGVEGAYLLRPVEPGGRQYGVVRTFSDEAARERFYASALYQRFGESVGPLVEGGPRKREIHGLEGLFVTPARGGPPAWKMAIVTWLAVNPAVFVFAHSVPEVAEALPPLVELLVVNAFVVASLTWLLMPALTRILRGWLAAPAEGRQAP